MQSDFEGTSRIGPDVGVFRVLKNVTQAFKIYTT